MGQAHHNYCVFETAAGFCGIAWNTVGISRFQLPSCSAAAAEQGCLRRFAEARRGDPPPAIAGTMAAARRYFDGEPVDFSDVALDLGHQDPMFTAIYAATRALRWGETTTYGALAKALGAGPEAARDVGVAMARNPVPLIIPCHRVLAAGGKVGGFSAPGGAQSKIRMLALEGHDLAPPPPAQAAFSF